jgi:succinyl-CoA synthetase beta subunit
MKLHEYKDFSMDHRRVAATADEAKQIAEELGGRVVIKSQVLVGGRGKAGGVKVAKNSKEAAEFAQQILTMTIKGLPVRKVLVDEAAAIEHEIYRHHEHRREEACHDRIRKASTLKRSSEKIMALHRPLLTALSGTRIAASIDLPANLARFQHRISAVAAGYRRRSRDQSACHKDNKLVD